MAGDSLYQSFLFISFEADKKKFMIKRQLLLLTEWAVLFVFYPVFVYAEIIRFNKILMFLPAIMYPVILFFASKKRAEIKPGKYSWLSIFLRLIIGGSLLLLLAYLLVPESMFLFPREKTSGWIMVMLLYPFVSALPQEFIYRKFYFWRYKDLFVGSEIMLLAGSTILFSFLHIIYDNYVAVTLTLIGGFIFSYTYSRSRNLIYPWVEHIVFGQMIFTFGLGSYFFEPLVK